MGKKKKSIWRRIFNEKFFETSSILEDDFELPDPRFDEAREISAKYSNGDFRALPKTPVNESIRQALTADLKLMSPENNIAVFPAFRVQSALAAGYDISKYAAGKHDSLYKQSPNQIHIVTFDIPDPDMNTARVRLCESLLAGQYSRLSENSHAFDRGRPFYDLITDIKLPVPEIIEDSHLYSEIVTETEYSAALYILQAAFHYTGKNQLIDRTINATPLEISQTIAQREEDEHDGSKTGDLYAVDPVFTGLVKQIYGEIVIDRCEELAEVLRSPAVDILKFNELMARNLVAAREELFDAVPSIYLTAVQWWDQHAKNTLNKVMEDFNVGKDMSLSDVFNLDYTTLDQEHYPSWLKRVDIGPYLRKDLGMHESGYNHIAPYIEQDAPKPD